MVGAANAASNNPFLNPAATRMREVAQVPRPETQNPPFEFHKADVNRDGLVDQADVDGVVEKFFTNDANADVNGDGRVDPSDLSMVASSIQTREKQPGMVGDLNQNGRYDVFDMVQMLQSMGTDRTEADLNGDGQVNASDLSMLLSNMGLDESGQPSDETAGEASSIKAEYSSPFGAFFNLGDGQSVEADLLERLARLGG